MLENIRRRSLVWDVYIKRTPFIKFVGEGVILHASQATNSEENVNEITIWHIIRLCATHLRLRCVVLAYMDYRSS